MSLYGFDLSRLSEEIKPARVILRPGIRGAYAALDREGTAAALLPSNPLFLSRFDPVEVLEGKKRWIKNRRGELAAVEGWRQAASDLLARPMDAKERRRLAAASLKDMNERARTLARLMGLSIDDWRIVNCHGASRIGWCSAAEKTLAFHMFSCLFPEEHRGYLAVHELSHIRHFDHSKAFWSEVGRYCPDYKSLRKEIKTMHYLLCRANFPARFDREIMYFAPAHKK